MDAEHLEGMPTHEEAPTTTLNSALHDEAAALEANSDQVIPGISEEAVNAEMTLDPELGQMHETDHRDDLFYDPSVDQSGSNQFMMPEMDNKVSGHVPQNINDMTAPTPLATVPVEHQTLMDNENDIQQQQNQQNDDEEEQENKRRRVQRACDACRRKKIRCDGAQAGKRNITCSNCQEQKIDCTYVEAAKRRGPPPGYIEALEWKVQKFEDLLARVKPELNLLQVVGPPIARDSFDLNEFTQSLSENGIDYALSTGRARATKTLAVSERAGSARKGKNPAMHLPNRSTTLANAIEPPPAFPVHSQAEVDAVMGLLGHGGPHDIDSRSGRHVENLIDRSGRMERGRSHSVLDPSLAPSSIVGKEVGGDEAASASYQARIKEAEEAQENHNHEFSLEVQNNFPEEGYRYHGKSCTPSATLNDA